LAISFVFSAYPSNYTKSTPLFGPDRMDRLTRPHMLNLAQGSDVKPRFC